jgi:glycosyltransferase involved in cell wall biosynthesis
MKTTSILINNYNNGRYIAECVDSALNQTVPADEIVVYDDGSTDESLHILRSYGSRIVLIEGQHDASTPSRENQSNAVYRAFERSSGEWLFLLDGDDSFAPNKVEQVLRAVRGTTGVSLVQSPMTLIDENSAELGRYRDQRFHHANLNDAIYEQNDVDFFYPTSAMVVSRAAMSMVLPLDMRVCPELSCDTRIGMLMPLLGGVVTIDESLACWRRHSGSYISALGRSRWFQAQQTWRRIRTFNAAAADFAAPKISLLANRRLRRQIAGALLPDAIRRKLRKTGTIFHGEPATAPKPAGA